MKKFKSALSLLTAVIMVFAMMPGVMAKTAQIADATVSVFNATGTADVLFNDWYFTHHETTQLYTAANSARLAEAKQEYLENNPSLGLTLDDYKSDGNAAQKAYYNWCVNEAKTAAINACSGESNLDKVVKFTSADSGIVWSWENAVSVKRIDLWIHTDGGVKDYEIQTSEDGITWNETPVKSGSFAAHLEGSLSSYDKDMTMACYYPIILDNAVETKYIRFVVKSFIDESSSAYIAEARIYDTNMINFAETEFYSTNSARTPYLWGYTVSGIADNQPGNQNNTSYTHARDNGHFLPHWGTGDAYRYPAADPDLTRIEQGIWYTTSFYRSMVKINHIGLKASNGTITEFEVWATNDLGGSCNWADDPAFPLNRSGFNWTRVAKIQCNLTPESGMQYFDLPGAIVANGYMIRATEFDVKPSQVDGVYKSGTSMSFELYSIADSEVSIPDAFDGVVVAENKASINISDKIDYNGKEYDVVWESDSEYLNAENGEIAPHEEDVEATLKATITVDGISYFAEKTLTLPAFENSLEITAFNGDGSTTGIFPEGFNESLFTDEYYRVAYDYNLATQIKGYDARFAAAKLEYLERNPELGFTVADCKSDGNAEQQAYYNWCKTEANTAKSAAQAEFSKHLEKVAKFTTVDSGIQWSWSVKETTKRLDLWLIGAGGIKDYEIQKSNNGTMWETVQSGQFAAASDNYAYYYPVVFKEPVTTKNLRIVIKSFYGDAATAYISEAVLRDTNEINLGQDSLIGKQADDKQYWSYSPYLLGFNASATSAGDNSLINGYSYVYPVYSDGGGNYVTIKADENDIWYATSFGSSKVKVNKFGVTVATGTVTKIEVYIANGTALHGTSKPTCPLVHRGSKDSYTKEPVAVINCNLTKENTNVLFEIPKAIAGNGILIKAKGTEDASIKRCQFYSVGDYELTPVAPTEEKIEGTVEAGQELTYSVFSCNYNAPDAKVFFALYEDGALSGVTVAPCALSGVKTAEAKYTIPAEATGALKVVAYLWDGKTLKPLVDTPVVAEPAAETPAE